MIEVRAWFIAKIAYGLGLYECVHEDLTHTTPFNRQVRILVIIGLFAIELIHQARSNPLRRRTGWTLVLA
jgi:hypothetical protein